MKMIGYILAAFILVVVAGVMYIGVSDAHVEQTTVVKNIEPPKN